MPPSRVNLRNLFLSKRNSRSRSGSRSRKGSRSGSRSRSNRQSTIGRIHSIMNIDSVEKAERLVKALKEAKTIITNFVAEWCGACQAWKPELEKIVKENNIVVPIAKVDESNMEMYNSVRKENGLSPITVDKYPTIMKEEGMSGPKEIEREEVVSVATNKTGDPTSMEIVEESIKTENPVSPNSSNSSIASPPSLQADEITLATSNPSSTRTTVGGCYQAMASTAFKLAPVGVLLAAAAATLKRKGKGKGKKGKATRKATRKNRR